MPVDRQSALVRHTLLELLYHGQEEKLAAEYPAVLTLLTYHFIGMQEGLESLHVLSREKARVSIFADDLFQKHYQQKQIMEEIGLDDWILNEAEAELKKERYQYIFLPVLSFSLMSTIINYDDRHPFVRLILWALFAGVQVGTLRLGINPVHASWRAQGLNHGNHSLHTDLRRKNMQLSQLGIQLLELEDVSEWLTMRKVQQQKQVITNQAILEVVTRGDHRLSISKGTIITPLAKDTAIDLGITIIEQD